MKRVTIKRLTLLNFKGQRNLTVDFSPGNTVITGANGTGKSTIFDAFIWLLFGKDSRNQSNFEIKTLDSNGLPIPKLPHEVSAVLDVDSKELLLSRRYNEIWRKKRGSAEEKFEGHETERLYNDVPCSVDEWSEKINAICPEQDFKYITDPAYFVSLKADLQRKKLCELAGDVDNEVLLQYPEFRSIYSQLQEKTLEELKREISAKKTRVNAIIKDIPSRIDERKRDMPKIENWRELESELNKKTKALKEAEALLSNSQESLKAANNLKIDKTKQLNQLKLRLQTRMYEVYKEETKDYFEAKKYFEIQKQTITELTGIVSRCQEMIESKAHILSTFDSQRSELLTEWKQLKLQKLEFSPNDFNCPTCGHPYDTDEVAIRQGEMLAAFNQKQSKLIEENLRKGTALKNRRLALENEISELKRKANEALSSMPTPQSILPAPGAMPTEEELSFKYDIDNECSELRAKIEKIEIELRKQPDEKPDSQLLEAITVLRSNIDELKTILARKEEIKRNEIRISELEEELKNNAQQYADLENLEFKLSQFAKIRMTAVDKKINSLFRLVKFRLYEKQINGGEKEICEATVEGVPYSSLNTAARVNAGIDIINVISQHIGITVPVFIENAEGVLNLEQTQGQVIKLVVADVPELTISK